jgi:hypothetical protein
MPNDPGLTDTCIFLNDGSPWWLSPDISLTGPISGVDRADPNPNSNVVGVTVRRNAGCMLSPAVGVINVDVYVGDPSVVMTPANTTRITNTTGRPTVFVDPANLPTTGGDKTATFNWVIPSPLPAGTNETPGHKCLIARVYPDNNTPSPTNFFVPDDPHVAQRNICIVPCDVGGGGEGPRIRAMATTNQKPCGQALKTANVNPEAAEQVTLIAVLDPDPSPAVREVVLTTLRGTKGLSFRRFATVQPRGFEMQFPDFPTAEVRDMSRPGCLYSLLQLIGVKFKARYEAQIRLAPDQVTSFNFTPEFGVSQVGDVHIFHITQVGQNQAVQGGITLVYVIV